MQLTKLQWIGLAISAAWALGMTFHHRQQEAPRAQDFAMGRYFVCAEQQAAKGSQNVQSCLDKVADDWDVWMNRQWGRISYLVFGPIAAGWLVGGLGVWVWRRTRVVKDSGRGQ